MIILRKRVAGLTSTALAMFVGRAARAMGLRGEVNVLVTSSQELRALNNLFRGKDKATDVLSFPAGSENGLAGDIAISAQIALQNAKELGHSAAEEIKILALHGVLHLAGYNHEREGGEMERKEARLRKNFGLPVGLIERSQLEAAGTARKKDPARAEEGRNGRAKRPSNGRRNASLSTRAARIAR